VFLEFDLIWLV